MKRYLRWMPLILCLILMLLVMTCVRLTFAIGDSMEPTYSSGDLLLVVRYFGKPDVGDAVLVKHEKENFWIKRVAAVSGERINDTVVPEGCVYIVGDNPDSSYDSRNPELGSIPAGECWGKVIWKIF